jgi:HNH endonuclease
MKNTRAPVFKAAWLGASRGAAARVAAFRKEQGAFNHRPNASARGYDSDWRELRDAFLASFPMCRHCALEGRERRAHVVDHIETIRNAPERRLDPSNLQSLCWPCHRKKTNKYDRGFGDRARMQSTGGPSKDSAAAAKTGPRSQFFAFAK